MAFHFFSKIKSTTKSDGATSKDHFVISTLQKDLENIIQGRTETPPTETESTSASITTTSLTSDNPFSETSTVTFAPSESVDTKPIAPKSPFAIISDPLKKPLSHFPQPAIWESSAAPFLEDSQLILRPFNKNRASFPKWVMWLGLGLFILLCILGGSWYFLVFRAQPVSITPEHIDDVVDPGTVSPPTPTPFSQDKANYLSLNTEIISPADIQKIFQETGDRIRGGHMTKPVEFLITDQNNNPLAFSRFAFLFGINLNPDLLALIQENFSLYMYDDAGSIRIGLVLSFKDGIPPADILTKEEAVLPYVLKNFILDTTVTIAKQYTFQSTPYKQAVIHFVNLDKTKNFSIDYSVLNNQWFIGTSKITLRQILDMQMK